VLGFDDIEVAPWAEPPLTTIHQPVVEIGRRMAEILIRQVEGQERDTNVVHLPCTLVRRRSVAPAKGER